jgi:hypothetical protein
LTAGEVALAASVFGDAIAYDAVTLNIRKWWPFQPRGIVMAPDGHIWFHPEGGLYVDDFSAADLSAQGLFIHEMTHVWQHQQGVYLPLRRHPFCRYGYRLTPGKPFERYGIEQQAEIIRHWFLSVQGTAPAGDGSHDDYASLLPFGAALV